MPDFPSKVRHDENQHAVGMMCRLLGFSRSGYCDWRQKPLFGKRLAHQMLAAAIKRIFDDEKGRTGSPRIMCDNGWRAKAAKKYKATHDSNHSLSVAPNPLEQNFTTDNSDQKWVSDITYIYTEERWLYLAVVLNLYSRRVIGWAIGERMTAQLVCEL